MFLAKLLHTLLEEVCEKLCVSFIHKDSLSKTVLPPSGFFLPTHHPYMKGVALEPSSVSGIPSRLRTSSRLRSNARPASEAGPEVEAETSSSLTLAVARLLSGALRNLLRAPRAVIRRLDGISPFFSSSSSVEPAGAVNCALITPFGQSLLMICA